MGKCLRSISWFAPVQLEGAVLQKQDNLAYGDATQLVGGYTAGYLVISCVTALVYLGFWLRCVIVLNRQRQDAGDLEAPPGGPPPGPPKGPPPSNKCLIRPLGPWLWPVALTHT